MRRSFLCALAAVVPLAAVSATAVAQTTIPQVSVPSVDPGSAESASPYGATYIPGVGFRYLAPGGARVYGYRAYGPRVYGYRRYRDERCFWFWDGCWRRR
jgi:hypothetical protein